MATDLYLIRKNQNFTKFLQVVDVSLSSSGAYTISGITVDTSTELLTCPVGVPAPTSGAMVYFSSLAGGAGLSINTAYYVINSSGNSFHLSNLPDGAVINITTPITSSVMIVTADDQIKIWSSEYRDLFATQSNASGQGSGWVYPSGVLEVPKVSLQSSFPGIGKADTSFNCLATNASGYQQNTASLTPTIIVASDEANHTPLRQSLLKRTHWRFDKGATIAPRYLYAQWQEGDIISDTPPDTL